MEILWLLAALAVILLIVLNTSSSKKGCPPRNTAPQFPTRELPPPMLVTFQSTVTLPPRRVRAAQANPPRPPIEPLGEVARYESTTPLPEQWKTAAFIDVETTGFARTDEIIEMAVVLFCYDSQTGEITACIDEYVGLREPTVAINPAAAAVNNLSIEQLRGQRLNELRIETMLARAEFIVAHNAPFDQRFVAPLFYGARNRPWLCSMSSVDWLGHGMPSRALQTLLEAHGITPQQAHRAAADVHATIDLLAARSPEGKPYFAEVLSKARLQNAQSPRRRLNKPRKVAPARKTRAAGAD